MKPKPQLSSKTKTYLLRVILAGIVALTIGIAGAGPTLQAAAEDLAQGETGTPIVEDVRTAPDLEILSVHTASGSSAPGYYDTSAFMTGSVAVGVILPESSGGVEDWTTTRVNNVKTQIQDGMNWWSNQYASYGSPGGLTITYDWHTPYDGTASVAVSSEPISNSSQRDYQWVNELLGHWGYTQSYTQSSDPDLNGQNTMYLRSLAYVNNLRSQKGTDWAFVIFVVDSAVDNDGVFSDGYFAYAYLYGPMMVMTYDNANWGIANMYKVAAHETGHIFGAGDQYYQVGYGGCTSKTQKFGYLGIPNSNCDYDTATGTPSLMKNNTMVLDVTARNQVGWRDSDSDGVFDPLDTPPSINLNNYTPNPTTNTKLVYSGTTYIQPWPHALCSASDSCYNKDITTQKLAVDYRVNGGPWQSASAADGAFSSDYEGFNFETGTLSQGTHNISVRSQNSQGGALTTWLDSVTIQPPSSPVSEVDEFPGKTFDAIPFTDSVDTTGATPNTGGISDPTPIVIGDCNSTQSEASVWYKYSPASSTHLYVDTLGSNYDTLIAIWTGNAGETDPGNLTLVACNDDIGTYEIQSKLGFFAQSGKTYYIEVIEWTESQSLAGGPGGILNFHVEGSNGSDTTGVFRPSNGALYLKNTNATGFADVQINYGLGGDYPVTGDWDGNGTDTIGIYRNGSFYLRNSNTIGFADLVFAFGSPGDQPIAGDWNGDGIDTIGVYRSSTGTFFLRNSNTAGAPEMTFSLGVPGDVGIAGDWDGNGIDTTGVFRPSNGALYLKNTNATGFADIQINYGLPGDQPVTGDWNNDGIDTIGIYRNGTFYLRNFNTIGFANIVFSLGVPGDMPIAGNWDGVP